MKYFDILFYVGVTMLVLWFVTVHLEFSLPELIRGLVKELVPLAELKWTRASVNGLLVVTLLVLTVLYFFIDRLRQAIELLHNLQHSSGTPSFEIVYAIFVVGIFGLLSLHALPRA